MKQINTGMRFKKIKMEQFAYHAYHITERTNLKSIFKKGLEPRQPEDYDDAKGVYLFKTLEDAEQALMGWLGERIESIEEERGEDYDLVYLKVNLQGLEEHLNSTVGYEWVCAVPIEPERIEIIEGESWG